MCVPFPVDDAWLDDLVYLEEDEAVREVAVEPVDLRVHAKRVHPVHVHPLLPRPQEVRHLGQLLRLVKRGVLIEQAGHERQVQLLEAIDDVVGSHEIPEKMNPKLKENQNTVQKKKFSTDN